LRSLLSSLLTVSNRIAPQCEDWCSPPYLNTDDKTLCCYISILYPLVQCNQPVKLLPSQRPQCHRVARSKDMEKPTWRLETSSLLCGAAVNE
jgi:hypothetical protein